MSETNCRTLLRHQLPFRSQKYSTKNKNHIESSLPMVLSEISLSRSLRIMVYLGKTESSLLTLSRVILHYYFYLLITKASIGNESDYIVISLVRTRSVGFLHDLRRSNVMLSRAKRGMLICSNRCFLESPEAKDTLIGKMAEEWSKIEGGWIMNQDMLTEGLYIE